jgi:RNA polymerase sigma-70 factor (ECF subfamily)
VKAEVTTRFAAIAALGVPLGGESSLLPQAFTGGNPPNCGTVLAREPVPREEAVAIDVDGAYRRYASMVLRRCRRLLRDEEKALDAMHDVFVNLLRARERLDADGPASLLMRMATNVCLNRLRGERRRPEDADDAALLDIATAEEPGARSVARLAVGALLGREPESTRVMAVLHFVDGLTLEEVGREVGLSAAAVRKRLRGLRTRVAVRDAQHDVEGVS